MTTTIATPDATTVDRTVVALADTRLAGTTVGEPGATARALMRGDATRAERRAHVLAALEAAGLTRQFTPDTPRVKVTRHQLPILESIASGASTTQAGVENYIAFATAKNHVRNLLTKFGTSSRVELIVEATRCGILAPPVLHPTPTTHRSVRCQGGESHEGCASRTRMVDADGNPACRMHGGHRQ